MRGALKHKSLLLHYNIAIAGVRESKMLKKYSFSDITVFMKNRSGEYVNLSDYEIGEPENQILRLNASSKYVIILNSFMFNSNQIKGEQNYACEIEFNELIKLAGITDHAFISRFKITNVDYSEDIFAMLCAKRILDYRYGEIRKVQENCYSFARLGFKTISGKKKKVHNVLFEKHFYTA